MSRTKRFAWLAAMLVFFSLFEGCDGGAPKHVVTEESVGRLFGIPQVSGVPSSAGAVANARVPEARKYFPAIEISDRCPKNRIVVASWNAGNFGAKKTSKEIEIMADVLREADIVLLQEVSTSEFGARAGSKLTDALSRTGSRWAIQTSPPTEPKNLETEAYAVLWKSSKVSFDSEASGLVKELSKAVSREPYRAVFMDGNGNRFSTYSFHAVPANKNPKNEVEAIAGSKELKTVGKAVFAGDFNLAGNRIDPILWKADFRLTGTGKTSLKQKPEANGNYRLHDFDHAYVKGFEICGSGIVDFVERKFSPVTGESLKEARKVSDHLPVWVAVH